MLWLRILLTVLFLTPIAACENRCWLVCTDQTAIQNDYLADRDNCRGYAQDKIDLAMRDVTPADEKARKSQLVSLFSQCMSGKSWSVPDGKADAPKTAGAPAAPATPAPVIDKAAEKALLQRTAECALARQYAGSSKIYAARADACDEECAEGLRLGPDAPRPAACGPANAPRMSKGVEKW